MPIASSRLLSGSVGRYGSAGRPARGQPFQRVLQTGAGVVGGQAPERAPRLDQVRAGVADVHEHPALPFPDRGGEGRAAPAPERLHHVTLRGDQGVREHVAGRIVVACEAPLDDDPDRFSTRPAAVLHASHAVRDHAAQ